ncbi:MAG: hypothetical protein HY851_11915 [candidate division Zixibacteria bacterium]|nr:hypothetical protein [candidate division Zixibacteria bacterium]
MTTFRMLCVGFLAIAAVALVGTFSLAEDSVTLPVDGESAGPKVTGFLTADGRIDLAALRASGYEGGLNLDGAEINIDPRTGEPIVGSGPVSSVAAAPNPSDIYWEDNGLYPPGVAGDVNALAVYHGKLIVAGQFWSAGALITRNIVAWDGTNWLPLGSPQGANSRVMAMTILDDKLIVGGWFRTVGGDSMQALAMWNDTSWSAVGPPVWNNVEALAVYDNHLVAAGMATIDGGRQSVALWDGTKWKDLGTNMSGGVRALAVEGNKLYAGGFFFIPGDVPARNVAVWDGTSWSYAAGMNFGYVSSLTERGGYLTAGHWNGISQWDGAQWKALRGNPNLQNSGTVVAIADYNGDLYAGGSLGKINDQVYARGLIKWDGLKWNPVSEGPGTSAPITQLAIYDGKVVAAGAFVRAGGVQVNKIATWDGATWSPLGQGVEGQIQSLAVYGDKLIVGGLYALNDAPATRNIAAWDGSAWSPMGTGVDGDHPSVTSLTVYQGKLIAGGYFTQAGGVPANRVASWDGSSWSALGTGMDNWVWALEVWNDQLVAGGLFTSAGGVPARHVAVWNGSSWSPMDVGTELPVRTMINYEGKLLVGVSDFIYLPGPPYFLAPYDILSWDGIAWAPFGGSGPTSDMTLYNGTLVAVGTFGVRAFEKGQGWTQLGSGVDYWAGAAVVYNDRLVIGGGFSYAGNKTATFLATWNGPIDCCLGNRGNIDCDPGNAVDISDLSALIDQLFINLSAPCCAKSSNVDASLDGNTDISDLSALIDHLFINFTPLQACN